MIDLLKNIVCGLGAVYLLFRIISLFVLLFKASNKIR
jgi:hypothetical protein